MKFVVQNRTIKAGFFKDAQDKIEREIQLHSFSGTDTSKGINLVFIWITEK